MNSNQHQPITSNPLQHQSASPGITATRACIGKHPTAEYKVELLQHYVNQGWNDLIETGLYNGHGSGMNVSGLRSYCIIDFQKENCEIAEANNLDAWVICGDSGIVLPDMLATWNFRGRKLLFWLDAHGIPSDEGFPEFPLFKELESIANYAAKSVVLIDDLCMFGYMLGSPPLEALESYVDSLGIWDRVNSDCIMRLEPIKGDL